MRQISVPTWETELAENGQLATADVIADLRFWQRYLIYAVCGLAFLIWLMLMGGRREDGR